MYKIQLSEQELSIIIMLEKKNQQWSIKRRYRCIRMRNEGIPCKEICKRLEVSSFSVINWTKKYLQGGAEILAKTYFHDRRNSSLKIHVEETKTYAQENNINKVKDIQFFLHQKTGKQYEFSRIRRRCKKHYIL